MCNYFFETKYFPWAHIYHTVLSFMNKVFVVTKFKKPNFFVCVKVSQRGDYREEY